MPLFKNFPLYPAYIMINVFDRELTLHNHYTIIYLQILKMLKSIHLFMFPYLDANDVAMYSFGILATLRNTELILWK